MANCDMECEDIKYETPLTPAPLPMPSDGGGHEFVTELPESGTPGVEYIVMGDPRDCSSFKGSYVWNNDCWVATSGAGGGALDNYTFEKTTTGWIAKKNNKVIFTYNDERITQNQTDITNIKNDIYNNYLVDRISVCEGGPLTLTVDATDPKKKKIKLCLDGDLGDKSDGAYEIKGELSTYLSTAILGTTPVNVANVPSLNPADIVIGETYLYDHQGTMGKVTAYDKTTGIMTVQTMTTSPGERAGVRLGAVETKPDLPTTITAAEGMGWLTPVEGDFAYVRQDGPNGDKLGEWLVQSIDAAGNITWAFSHYINAGNYVVDVLLSDGTLIPKNPDGTVTLPNYVRTVELADGTVLPVDAQGKVTLPDFGMLKGVRTSDGTLLTIAADGTVTLPVIPKKFDTYKIETSYKDWLNVKTDIDKVMTIDPAKLVGITKEGAAMTVANFATDVLPNRDLIYVHGVDGTNETQEAIAWFDSYNATTGIKLRILAIPRGGGGGGGGASDKEVPEYTRDLHAGDIINHLELITYDNILYRMKDTAPYTLTGTWANDKTHFEVINSEAKNTYYNLNRDGQELKSMYASLETDWTTAVNQTIPFVKRSGTFENPAAGVVTIPKDCRVEFIYNHASSAPAGDVQVGYYNNTDGVWISDPNASHGNKPFCGYNIDTANYCLGACFAFQWTNDTGHDVNVSIRIRTNAKTANLREDYSGWTVKEIGRIVDPIAYMLDDGKAEDSPVGNIISYMGNNVPAHYLACDGSAYAIGTYPELEAHFLKEFGSITHFGAGAAANTYKVPDLRGEFLRGTGANSHTNPQTGNAEGSGLAVGSHQSASALRNIWHYDDSAFTEQAIWYSNRASGIDGNLVNQPDAQGPRSTHSRAATNSNRLGPNNTNQVYATTRPTNTSVKYCIKYETVPRVIVDQGTYKASVKCSVAAAGATSSSQFVFDNTDVIGDKSMVSGDTFVAPVDGMYSIGCQISTRGSGAVSNFLTINGVNTCWGRGLNPGGLVNLRAGDTVSLSLYGGSSANSGRANIALVNTVADAKVAETMLKPNTWAVGVEQNFGDGVYGVRLTGTSSNKIDQNGVFKIPGWSATTSVMLQQGGSATTKLEDTLPVSWVNASTSIASQSFHFFVSSDGNLNLRQGTEARGSRYDVWFLYKK